MKALRVFVAVLAAALTLVATLVFSTRSGASHRPSANPAQSQLPDLLIQEFTVSPSHNPELYAPVTFTVKACNMGDVSAYGRRVHLYIDPGDTPPLSTTLETKRLIVMGMSWNPGDCVTASYGSFTFGQSGRHVAYAWVDPYELREESNEDNNLAEITIDVQPEIQDIYEPDNACSQAKWIPTDGTVQTRVFTPTKDVDWVAFAARAGSVYTITASGTGEDAYPVFELWSTCSAPPESFGGTTFKLGFKAPETGDYILKLYNDLADYDPAQSGYQLTVHSQAVVSGIQPVVSQVTPTLGYNDRNTHVVITGNGFVAPPKVSLCPAVKGTCGECTHVLDNASWPDNQTIFAIVPANLPDGDYCLAVTNPGGKVGTLPGAFKILPGQPDLRRVFPGQGYSDAPTDLNVYGFNFHPGISVTLGNIGLGNVVVVNQTYLRATVPVSLTSGAYAMNAFYATGEPSVLPDAYTVLQSGEDLFAKPGELWVDPVAPRAGQTVRMGLLVHRTGGSATLMGVPVRFSADGQVLGDVHVPLLPPDGEESTRRLEWIPPQAGVYHVTAAIDPDDQVSEASEANNVVTHTITVLGWAADDQAPTVDSLVIKDSVAAMDGAGAVTDTLVFLAATATDHPLIGGTGVSHLRYIEFEYSEGAKFWIPVQDSGWVISDTINATNYRWQLTPVAGLHYIQAWAKDAQGNVSHYPRQQKISYLPSADWVGEQQTRTYWWTLAAGETLSVTLTPASEDPNEDPDLYVWAPDWQEGRDPWVSNAEGNQVDRLVVTAPVSGVYAIEVYGYTSAAYRLDITVGGKAGTLVLRSPSKVTARRWPRSPVIPGEPPLDTPPQEANALYLPLVLR